MVHRKGIGIFVVLAILLPGGLTGPAAAAEVTVQFAAASAEIYDRPHDLVLSPDGTRLFVADLGNNRVSVLDPQSLALLGTLGGEELSSPHDVAFDGAGRLLVADTGHDRIAVYAVTGASGRLVASWGDGLSGPEGVAAASDGRVYVANAAGHDLVVFRDGRKVAQAGRRGSGPLAFVRPHDIDLDDQGQVHVADPGNNRIQVLDGDLGYLGMIGGPAYGFNEPKYFDLGADGWMLVADEYNHRILLLDPTRQVVTTIGSGEAGKGPARFNYPEGAERHGNDLWIADTRNGRIVRYRLSGLP